MKNNLPLIYRILKPWEKHRLKKVSEMITGNNLDVMEIGCNDGKFLFDNKNRWKSIIGVDIKSDLLRQASKRNYGVSSKFESADFGRNPMSYKSNQFDLIVSIATIQYMFDLDLLFSEIHRVLKPNGLFIFEVPNLAVFWRRVKLLFGHLPKTTQDVNGWQGGVIHNFTCFDLINFIRKKNFKIERISCSGIMDSLREKWVSFLGADLIFVCRKTK